MGLILITGPDGSGKSTLIDKLEETFIDENNVLRVPTIDAELFASDHLIYKTAKFLNYLGKRADDRKEHSFKIIAMFGAMAIFNRLVNHLSKGSNRVVFCERHPLIDTAVYATLYLKVMDPELLDLETAKEIEETDIEALEFIISVIKPDISRSGKGACYDLLRFLYAWFSTEKENTVEHLTSLFEAAVPDHVYFLSAKAKNLLKRIDDRESQEYHENEQALAKMEALYHKVLNSSSIPFELVRTDNWEAANQLANDLVTKYA